jgi:release factor glutamine methyltransferase
LRDTAVALTAAGIDNARFEARLLLARASGLAIEQIVARGTDEVPAALVEALRVLTARRVRREPMAYILGEREFWGLPFKVSPAVLVPRPDSETMIEAVVSLLPDRGRAWRILDLGLGSGCLLLTLLCEYRQAKGVGLEVSAEALAVAEENARALGVAERVRLIGGDWRCPGWAAGLGGPFDLVVSNPPYIASAAIRALMPEVSSFEPRLALDGGQDGFEAYRAVIAAGPQLVSPGGFMAVEAGYDQASEIKRLFEASGMRFQALWKDLGGIDRIVVARN